jgi:hypothetical protein
MAVAWAGHQSQRQPEAVGLDSFPVYAEDPLAPFHRLINDYLAEALGKGWWWRIDVRELDFGGPLDG